MSVILDVNDLMAAAWEVRESAPETAPRLDRLTCAVEEAARALARELAEREGVVLGDVSTQLGFGGLCATFTAAADGAGSALLHSYDKGGDWG